MKWGSIKSTEAKYDGITAWLGEKIPMCYIVKCQSRNFLTELSCNFLFQYFLLIPTSFFNYFLNIVVCLVF